jgi:CheY-like chemotaxis protein
MFHLFYSTGTRTSLSPTVKPSEGDSKLFYILFVDDVALCRKLPIQVLKDSLRGYREACNGVEAVDLVRESIVTGQPFDAIIMYNSMPKMNGSTAAKEIRGLSYTGKIFGVTGNGLKTDVDDFIAHGVDEVIIKPLKKADFAHILQSIKEKASVPCSDASREA